MRQSIVVAYDGSDAAKESLEWAVRNLQTANMTFHVLSAYQSMHFKGLEIGALWTREDAAQFRADGVCSNVEDRFAVARSPRLVIS